MNRRRFLVYSLLATPGLAYADAAWLEPGWIKTRTLRIGDGKPKSRLVHFTDLHHKGDVDALNTVVKKINALSPDVVCFTGDVVEKSRYLPEALEWLAKIKSPMYGVPGNHDHWSSADLGRIGDCFASTGGEWLFDKQITTADRKFNISGASCQRGRPKVFQPLPGGKNILLLHYPMFAGELTGVKYDLMLAGHSHGGQVRLPFYGPIMLPYWVGKYDLGMYDLPAGPLYVNPGVGWTGTPVRFNCRPEITVFEI